MNYPAFVDTETFFSIDSGLSELEQATALAEDLKKIHWLTTRHFDDFETLINVYLQTGLEIFNMEIGIVSQIRNEDYVICDVVSPDGALKKGDVFPLEGTYCREVCRSQEVLGFPHVGALEAMKSHPVYVNMKLESYLSAPIYTNNQLFGTLNFTSTKIRFHGFSEHERDLISMMANAIGTFLVLDQKEKDLINANTRLKSLVGYVAHDLRSPMGNIVSLAQIVSMLDEDEKNEMIQKIGESTKKALGLIYNILEMAAMGTGKIELHQESVAIKPMIQAAVDQMHLLAEKNQVKIEQSVTDLKCTADAERLNQVLTNLLSNAIKYSPKGETVQITAERNDYGKVVVTITNRTLSEPVEVSKSGFTQDHSIGFGLEIVREVLALHGSAFDLHKELNRFTSSFQLAVASPIEG